VNPVTLEISSYQEPSSAVLERREKEDTARKLSGIRVCLGVSLKGIRDFMESDEWREKTIASGVVGDDEQFPSDAKGIKEVIERLHQRGFTDPFKCPALRVLSSQTIADEIWNSSSSSSASSSSSSNSRPLLKHVIHANMNGYDRQAIIKKTVTGQSWVEEMYDKGDSEVGSADVFLSWALSSRLVEMHLSIENWIDSQTDYDETTKFWVCDFTIDQNSQRGVERLPDMIERIGNTLLYFEKWDLPVPLKRAWCVFEIFHAIVNGGRIEVLTTESDKTEMLTALRKSSVLDTLWGVFADIKVEEAKSFKQRDRERIFKMIEDGPGCAAINSTIRKFVQTWMLTTCADALGSNVEVPVGMGLQLSGVEMLELHSKVGTLFREVGSPNRSTEILASGKEKAKFQGLLETTAGAQLVCEAGITLRMKGDNAGAEAAFLEAQELYRAAGTLESESGMMLVRDIGWTKFCKDDYEGAHPHLKEAASICEAAGILNTPQGSNTLSALATATHSLGDPVTAVELHEKGLAILRNLDALQNPMGAKQLNELATGKRLAGDVSGAHDANTECLAILNMTASYNTHKGAEAERELGGILAAKLQTELATAAYARSLGLLHATSSYETFGGLKLLVEKGRHELLAEKDKGRALETLKEALRVHGQIAGSKDWSSARKDLIVASIEACGSSSSTSGGGGTATTTSSGSGGGSRL
jgi:tetratricopeptide (TPR) repeat protein